MRKNLTILLLSAWALSAAAQVPDSGTFLLHKFAQNIGKEHYTLQFNEAGPVYSIAFKFVDRGSPVPLIAKLGVTQDNEPLSLIIKGNTSRFSTITTPLRSKTGRPSSGWMIPAIAKIWDPWPSPWQATHRVRYK